MPGTIGKYGAEVPLAWFVRRLLGSRGTAATLAAWWLMAGDHLARCAILSAAEETGVSRRRLPALLDVAPVDLAPRLGDYHWQFERIFADDGTSVFLAEPRHWEAAGDRLGFSPTEVRALARAHEAHLRHVGSMAGRGAEFESALDIRAAVVIDTSTVPVPRPDDGVEPEASRHF